MAGRRSPILAVLSVLAPVVIVTGLVLLWLALPRTIPVPRSAIGLDGLVMLLDGNGVDSQVFTRGGAFDPDVISLRIIPLYDADLQTVTERPQTEEERYLNETIQPIFEHVLDLKIETLPTLIVLPKWRDGLRIGGFIHPEFLIAANDSDADAVPGNDDADEQAAAEIEDWESEIYADDDGIEMLDTTGSGISGFRRLSADSPAAIRDVPFGDYGQAALYAPQYAAAPFGCEALIGRADRGLLFECEQEGHTFWVLSDPDLVNNHGLARAGNAQTALNLVRDLAGGGRVLVDYTNYALLWPDEPRGRSLSDLLRYFEPPFRWLWLAGLLLLAALLWRGGVRGLPLVRQYPIGHGAARRTSFAAQAGLMRRSRADGALLKALLASRLGILSDRFLGRDISETERRRGLLRALRHRDARVADALDAAITEIDSLDDTAGADATVPALSRLENAYRKALILS